MKRIPGMAKSVPRVGADITEVEAAMGRPELIEKERDIMDDVISIWKYPGTEIFMNNFGRVFGAKLSAPGHVTPRGLQVGDPVGEVHRLYGPPERTEDEVLAYRLVTVTVRRGVVEEIYSWE